MKINIKQIFLTICIFAFCIIDWILGSQGGPLQGICANLIFVLLSIIIISHYHIRDFFKAPYFIGAFKRPVINLCFLSLFMAFVLLVICSRNDFIWTTKYLSLLLVYYLTPFTKKEHSDFISALLNGVILSFVFLQSVAFVIRPYDTLRYQGMYANANINSLFYQVVYCAFLGKFCLSKASNSILKWIYFSFACAMWSFVFLTMCRSAMMGMGAATIIAFAYYVKKSRTHKLLNAMCFCVCFIIISILSFPTVYSSVRYLPAFFHRPAYFYNEYSDSKVNSNDSFDSDKYTDWKDVIEENLGRFKDVFPIKSAVVSVMADNISSQVVKDKSTTYRIHIFKYYASMLNVNGHLENENGIQVSSDYYAPHAHNLMLQYCFNYGLPAGILFLLIILVTMTKLLYETFIQRKKEETYSIVALLFYTSIIVFGITEIMWQRGQFSTLLLYLIPYWTWAKNRL